jgi:hypothetical protein
MFSGNISIINLCFMMFDFMSFCRKEYGETSQHKMEFIIQIFPPILIIIFIKVNSVQSN